MDIVSLAWAALIGVFTFSLSAFRTSLEVKLKKEKRT